MWSMWFPNLAADIFSMPISLGPVRVATCARPTASKSLTLILATRFRCLTHVQTPGMNIFDGMVIG